jgi:hypothetical protein
MPNIKDSTTIVKKLLGSVSTGVVRGIIISYIDAQKIYTPMYKKFFGKQFRILSRINLNTSKLK